MKIHELNVAGTPDRKRVGRGIGAGQGKTAGRGTKGQNSRTGGGVRLGFAGGQNPLAKLLPKKRGFRALNHKNYQTVSVSSLNRFADNDVVGIAVLVGAGLVKQPNGLVKLLADTKSERKLTVRVHAASKTAVAAIEAAGGTVEVFPLVKQPSKKATRPQVDGAVIAE